jgi:DNA-binding NtrC family response regulator
MPETTPIRILIADDQPDIIDALRLLLVDEGYEVSPAGSPAEALERLEAADFDLALLDLNYTRDTTSGQEGFDLMERIRALDPTLPVLVMTAWSSVAGAVEAMRRGARDYIEKPWDDEKVLAAVRTQIELRRAVRRSQRLQEANTRLQRGATPAFIGETTGIREIRQTIERVAPSDASVLITGEHGTGKEVVAAWLHALSDRRGKPLVTMNAGGLAEGIAESELFGHVKGAFTDARVDRIGCFEMADEGTLFLDEIANMPVRLQAKLLRVLQTGEVQRVGSSRLRYVNARVLSATNADLQEEIAAGRFREDLLYRLNTVVIHISPLRERRDDVEPLARHFLARHATRYRKPLTSFDKDALSMLRDHSWPGNVRELGHAIERAVLMADASSTSVASRFLGLQRPRAATESVAPADLSLEDAERIFIEKVLARHHGDVRLAAQQLGMSRSALYRRLQQYGVRS